MTALPYISKYSNIQADDLGHIFITTYLPHGGLLKEISRSWGVLVVICLPLLAKKVCVEEREVKGSQFVTQCHVKITPLIYFHLGTLCYYCYYYSLDLVGGAFFALQLFECNHLILFGYLILQGRYCLYVEELEFKKTVGVK